MNRTIPGWIPGLLESVVRIIVHVKNEDLIRVNIGSKKKRKFVTQVAEPLSKWGQEYQPKSNGNYSADCATSKFRLLFELQRTLRS